LAYEAPYRVVVTASPGLRKSYGWEIVRDEEKRRVVRQSSVAYRSMEEAYEHGAVALKLLLRA
jgi:hypothetical protein